MGDIAAYGGRNVEGASAFGSEQSFVQVNIPRMCMKLSIASQLHQPILLPKDLGTCYQGVQYRVTSLNLKFMKSNIEWPDERYLIVDISPLRCV